MLQAPNFMLPIYLKTFRHGNHVRKLRDGSRSGSGDRGHVFCKLWCFGTSHSDCTGERFGVCFWHLWNRALGASCVAVFHSYCTLIKQIACGRPSLASRENSSDSTWWLWWLWWLCIQFHIVFTMSQSWWHQPFTFKPRLRKSMWWGEKPKMAVWIPRGWLQGILQWSGKLI